MVILLLMIIFLSLIMLCLWVYTRNVMTSAAADAARYAANADVTDSSAGDRARSELQTGIFTSTAGSLRCTSSAQGQLVSVTCTMKAPGIVGFLDGVMPDITVTGHSVKESTP